MLSHMSDKIDTASHKDQRLQVTTEENLLEAIRVLKTKYDIVVPYTDAELHEAWTTFPYAIQLLINFHNKTVDFHYVPFQKKKK